MLCYDVAMHELDDPTIREEVLNTLREQLKVQIITEVGSGNEFYIFGAELPSGKVAIKVPKDRVFSNVNDAHIDSSVLIDQEFALMRHVKAQGITQIPNPIQAIQVQGFDALVMSYVESDDSKADEFERGVLLAKIHSLTLPDLHLSAQEDMELPELIAKRLHRRWHELTSLTADLPELPAKDRLRAALEPTRQTKQLLHMDFRQANFCTQNGKIVALLDWSNALIGHPSLELARAAVTHETGPEFLRGYESVRPLPEVPVLVEAIFRLDTATMLALVFLSEEPDPVLAASYVQQVHDVHKMLVGLLSKIA